LTERPISDPRVLEWYHHARHEIFFGTKISFERAKRMLQQGLDTLGEHPLLLLGLAQAHYNAVDFAQEPRDDALRHAAEFTRRLEDTDPRYAHALRAKRERFTGSQIRAIRHFEDAVAANPGDVDSLWYLSHSYSFHAGKPAAGAAISDRLIRIDPLTVANLFTRAFTHWADANFAQALAVSDDMHRREPGLRLNEIVRMEMMARLGSMEDACRVADETISENPEDAWAWLVTALKHALLGEREYLLSKLTDEFGAICWNDPEGPQWAAGWLALVNERDRALDWLERWVDRGSINYPLLAHGDPLLEPLRGLPRFQRLLDRVRPEWESFVPRFQPA
jgi:tetratricopeptide (TPR) repeat protein